MSELKILLNNYGLEIWKGKGDQYPFNRNDIRELKNCIEKVLSKDVDEYEFKREKYGSFRLARVNSEFRLYGNLNLYFSCTESELKRLLKNVCEILSSEPGNYDKLTVKDLKNSDVLLIANENDVKAAIKIKEKLSIDFQYSAIICDDVKWNEWHNNDSSILIDKPQISIGGPKYNDTTKYLEENSTKKIISSFTNYTIKIGTKDLIIYGHDNLEQTAEATEEFLNSGLLDLYVHYVRQYLEKIAPKDKPSSKKDEQELAIVEPNNRDKKSSIPQETLDSIIIFTLPAGIEWKQLAIGFADDSCKFDIDDVQKKHSSEIRTFKEMGFQNQKSKRNSIKPYKEVLGRLADNNCKLSYKKNDAKLIERIAIVNERLQYFFKIDENLIECNRGENYYYSRFKIYKRSDT